MVMGTIIGYDFLNYTSKPINGRFSSENRPVVCALYDRRRFSFSKNFTEILMPRRHSNKEIHCLYLSSVARLDKNFVEMPYRPTHPPLPFIHSTFMVDKPRSEFDYE